MPATVLFSGGEFIDLALCVRILDILLLLIYFLRLVMVTKERLKETLREYGVHKYCSDWEDLVKNLMTEFEKTYNEGYSFCKKESMLVEKAAESLSDL